MTAKLTDLPGVGAKTAENLRKVGFDDPKTIKKATPRQLSRRVSGIGMKSARKIVEAAGGETVTIKRKTKAEQMQDMYGDIFKRINETPASEIKQEIRESDDTDLTEGVREFKDDDRIESPFRVNVVGPRKQSVSKIHSGRSDRAQHVDEEYNAPVTVNEEKWIQNPNRYDYPGVDTIPATRQGRRAETAAKRAKDRGAVDRVEQKGSAKNLQGKFSPRGSKTYGIDENVVRVQGNANQPERTLAHEVGHAIDRDFGDGRGNTLTDRLFDLDSPASEADDEELAEEAFGLSKKARGDFKGQEQYRRQFSELTADVVGQAIIQPRATKRDAPELFGRLEEAAEEEGFDDIFGDDSDPKPVLGGER